MTELRLVESKRDGKWSPEINCEHQHYFNSRNSWLCKPTALEFQHNLEPSPTLIFLTLQPVVIGPFTAAGIFAIVFPLFSFSLFNFFWQLQGWMPNSCVCPVRALTPIPTAQQVNKASGLSRKRRWHDLWAHQDFPPS